MTAFKLKPTGSIGTSGVSVLDGTAGNSTTIIGLTVSNITNGIILVDVYITRAGTDYYLLKGTDLLPGRSVVPSGADQKLVLESGDSLKVKSSVAASVDVLASYMLYPI